MPDRERRRGTRVPVQMWVEERGPEGTYFNHSANLSAGGIYLDQTIPHPVGTRVQLEFTLPSDPEPIRVSACIVNALTSEKELGMGLRFVDPPAEIVARIETFIRAHGTG